MESAFSILAEWAWAKVSLEALQLQMKESPTAETPEQVEAAMKAFRHALRKKKALDAEEAHERSKQQTEPIAMSSNLPPGVLPQDIEGPQMPRCVRCGECYSDYEDSLVKLCPDCYEEVAKGDDDFSA